MRTGSKHVRCPAISKSRQGDGHAVSPGYERLLYVHCIGRRIECIPSAIVVAPNESVLQKFFAAGDAGAVDRFEAFLHENAIVHAPFGLSTSGLIAEAESWRKAKQVIPDLRHEFQLVVVDGAHEAARCVVTGTLQGELGRLTAVGASFSVDQALFARVRDGKIEELWEIVDTASLEQQLTVNGSR